MLRWSLSNQAFSGPKTVVFPRQDRGLLIHAPKHSWLLVYITLSYYITYLWSLTYILCQNMFVMSRMVSHFSLYPQHNGLHIVDAQ